MPIAPPVPLGLSSVPDAVAAIIGKNGQTHGLRTSLLTIFKTRRRTGRGTGRCGVKRGSTATFASLGFSADPRIGIERAATALMKDAATLLVYQDVFRSPQAQAFLKVLLALRRGDDGLKLLDSYGEFFRLMAVGDYSSWEDHILEGILIGEANPFAEAAASFSDPHDCQSKEVPSSLEAAAAADLDALQRLSITESTLSSWVADLSDAKPEWRSAAASSLNCQTGTKKFDNKREVWRKKIGGLWKWSEAVTLLKDFYTKHGVGRVAISPVLLVRSGKLVRDSKFFDRGKSYCELTVHASQREDIVGALREHSLKYTPNHLLLCGPTGAGKSMLLHAIFRKEVREELLHFVTMPETELKNLGFVLEELGKFHNIRFVLFIDDPFVRGVEENFRIIKSALDGNFQDWPENVFLIVTSSRSEIYDGMNSSMEASSVWAELKHLIGRVLILPNLNFDEFLQCVQEMIEQRKRMGFSLSERNAEDIIDAAKCWTQQQGRLNLRSAIQLARTLW